MSVFYNEVSPEESYKTYIQKFWVLDNSLSPFSSAPQHALPNGCCTIAFISGIGGSLNYINNTVDLSEGIYLSGQITRRVRISLKPYSKAIMAQLKPWVPPMLTKVPMIELTDNVLSVKYVNEHLYRRLCDADIADETIVIAKFYDAINQYLKTDNDSYFIKWFFSRLCKGTPNKAEIANITAASGYTQRRIEQKFRDLVGPSAKEMQLILKLRQLIDDMQRLQNQDSLSILAHRYGYYDQSHFIKSYRHINFESPSQFSRDKYLLPLTGHFDFLQS